MSGPNPNGSLKDMGLFPAYAYRLTPPARPMGSWVSRHPRWRSYRRLPPPGDGAQPNRLSLSLPAVLPPPGFRSWRASAGQFIPCHRRHGRRLSQNFQIRSPGPARGPGRQVLLRQKRRQLFGHRRADELIERDPLSLGQFTGPGVHGMGQSQAEGAQAATTFSRPWRRERGAFRTTISMSRPSAVRKPMSRSVEYPSRRPQMTWETLG